MSVPATLPPEIEADLRRAARLEWQTLGWLAVIVSVMTFALGGSQAFRTAWVEDMLSLMPPALFLISRRVERLDPRPGFPFGFQRAGSLAFFFSAGALCGIGLFLLYEGLSTLLTAEHPTVGSQHILGVEVWSGWIMVAALAFSVVPPVILGRRKRVVAERLRDKVLAVDAETNAADWHTGAAGIVGIVGIAFGLWWADAAMACLIALGVLRDGLKALAVSTVSLLDGVPREIGSLEISDEVRRLQGALERDYPGARVQIRETGRFLRARVEPEGAPGLPLHLRRRYLDEAPWRLLDLAEAVSGRLDRPWPPDRAEPGP